MRRTAWASTSCAGCSFATIPRRTSTSAMVQLMKSESDSDKLAAYSTLYECLTTLAGLVAPMTPYLAEDLYRNLVRSFDDDASESVHLCDWPRADASKIDRVLSEETRLVMRVASL